MPELRYRFWTLLVFLLIIATTCLATSSVGLMCSALVRRTSTAMVLTYLTLLVLFVLPMGLSWYLEGMSQDQLASPRETGVADDHQSVLGRAQRADAHQPHRELDRASR